MNTPLVSTLLECMRGSEDGRLTFPQVIGALTDAGVEQYHADFVRGDTTYYLPGGESHVMAFAHKLAPAAPDFDAAKVEETVRTIQAGKIDYLEFCRRILAAGCVGYLVFVRGRRTIYYGRTGDLHIEHFPGKK